MIRLISSLPLPTRPDGSGSGIDAPDFVTRQRSLPLNGLCEVVVVQTQVIRLKTVNLTACRQQQASCKQKPIQIMIPVLPHVVLDRDSSWTCGWRFWGTWTRGSQRCWASWRRANWTTAEAERDSTSSDICTRSRRDARPASALRSWASTAKERWARLHTGREAQQNLQIFFFTLSALIQNQQFEFLIHQLHCAPLRWWQRSYLSKMSKSIKTTNKWSQDGWSEYFVLFSSAVNLIFDALVELFL